MARPVHSSDAIAAMAALASAKTRQEAVTALDDVRAVLGDEAPTWAPLLQNLIERVSECFRLQDLAGRDELTGIANRRVFRDSLEREVARNQRHGGGVAVVLLDLDHLKLINDTLGHARGDEAIAKTARACIDALRATDLVARIGGDEFAVLLPATNEAAAEFVASRLRARVEKEFVGDRSLHVSIGHAAAADRQMKATEILALADARLYNDKRERKSAQPAPRAA